MGEQTSNRGDLDPYWRQIDKAVIAAADYLDLTDVDSDNEDDYWDDLEARTHCSTCTVRSVMEIIHPAYQSLIDYLTGPQDAD